MVWNQKKKIMIARHIGWGGAANAERVVHRRGFSLREKKRRTQNFHITQPSTFATSSLKIRRLVPDAIGGKKYSIVIALAVILQFPADSLDIKIYNNTTQYCIIDFFFFLI